MHDIDRRDFLLAALGGIGLLTSGGSVGGTEPWGRLLPELEGAVAIRKNVYCLTPASRDIVAYGKAIAVMRSRPANDPTSWLAQANIHGAFAPPAGMIANACEHGATFFLSWHRMYLHFFERIIRKASGDPSFALPYWGYSSTGQRNLPQMFRDPADATNPLFVSQRRPEINAGNNLSASAVDPGPSLLSPTFLGFSSAVNGTPHGVVHTGVGGPTGWMSAFETAGQDPIFWLHHANIDRLWEIWLASGSGHANPTGDTNWMGRSFTFYDENGATVSLTGAQVVDTATQLSYRYAWTGCIQVPFDPRLIARLTRLRPFPPPGIVGLRPPIPPRPPLPDPVPLARIQSTLTLGAGAAQARLSIAPDQRRRMAKLAEPGAEGQLVLQFQGITLDQPPVVYYEVYLNLPKAGADTVYTSPHYVGNLDFFGPSPEGRRGKVVLDRRLDVVPAFRRLRATKQWRDDTVNVTLVPRGYTEGEAPSKLLGKEPQARVGKVELRLE